jgi:hypothetical protein
MRRTPLLVLTTGLVATACARGSVPLAAPTTVRVDQTDANRTITLHPADTLVIDLGGPNASKLLQWRLTGYPTGVLVAVRSDEERGVFWLVAKRTGQGRVVVVSSVDCGPGPLPAAGMQCPVVGGGDLGQTPPSARAGLPPGAIAARQFSITVRVV